LRNKRVKNLIEGFRIGQYTDLENATGCTVVLAPTEGAVAGVDVRGPAPGTLGTEALGTGRLIERVHAVVLAGGSAYGLDTVAGVMRYLEENGIGFRLGSAVVPIVAGAILFDLTTGSASVRPTAENAYEACLNATTQVMEGNVGAGTGATVGKMLGMEHATKGGIGYDELRLANDVTIAGIVAVNAVGDVVEPKDGAIVGGARHPQGGWLDSGRFLLGTHKPLEASNQNTTIGVVMTDATVTVEQANLIALMAHDGIARATRPSHTITDGDTIFVLASGSRGAADISMLGHAAAECVAKAIVRGVRAARPLAGIKAWDS
jgi:L-aminopeptidase/D-esterase-like protein